MHYDALGDKFLPTRYPDKSPRHSKGCVCSRVWPSVFGRVLLSRCRVHFLRRHPFPAPAYRLLGTAAEGSPVRKEAAAAALKRPGSGRSRLSPAVLPEGRRRPLPASGGAFLGGEAGRPAGAAPVPSGSPPAGPFLRAAAAAAAARMGEAESSAGAAEGKLPCPAIGPPGPASAPPEQPVPQAAPEEEAAAAAAAAGLSVSSSSAAAAATTTPAVAATMTAAAAAAMMTTTPAPAPPPPPPLPVPTVVWSPEVEVCLFHAMLGHKPVGVNRHFHMICIRDKFSQNIGRQISSKVIWDHLSTMYDMQALHESEILPFPNSEKSFILPEEIIQEVKEGKVMMEEDIKEEIKEEMESHAGSDEVYVSLGSLAKAAEKPSNKEKERSSSESGSKEGGDKRKRNRVTEKVLNANSNPSSPSAAKRRRT